MVIEAALRNAARAWRTVAGTNSKLERLVKSRYRRAVRTQRGRTASLHTNKSCLVVTAKGDPEPRRGVYMKGGCDLPSLFLAGPVLADTLTAGSVAFSRPAASVGSSHTSQILQALDGIEASHVAEACERLEIQPDFFTPSLFEPTFTPEGMERFGAFPKSVIVLSIGSDLTRSLHRHREHGFLVDIGGWWLNQSMEKAIEDTDTLRWFKKTFEPVGRIAVEDFVANMRRLVPEIRRRVGAELMVFNTLVVEPGKQVHNYQLLNPEHSGRRRDFVVALSELSGELDFHVVDVDGILKDHGVREQVDFAHFPVERKQPVAEEGLRILGALGVV